MASNTSVSASAKPLVAVSNRSPLLYSLGEPRTLVSVVLTVVA